MSDAVSSTYIPEFCEWDETCEAAPTVVVQWHEYSGLCIAEIYVCADHEAVAQGAESASDWPRARD